MQAIRRLAIGTFADSAADFDVLFESRQPPEVQLAAEETATSVSLKRAEGHVDTVPRSEIESLVSTRQSIMPEGFEKQLDQQAMADEIAFLIAHF